MSLFHYSSFSDPEILELQKLLEEREGVPYTCEREISGIWLHTSDFEAELRLLLLGQFRVTVSRVCFCRQRKGTMTAVLAWLEHFCRIHQVQSIVIQCVQTEAMANWCQKNDFQPIPHASINIHEIVLGDYKKSCSLNGKNAQVRAFFLFLS